MKTLKQIREEYKNFYTSQVPEEVLLEKSVIPSTKEMPAIILFKRVSFRSYPKGQVVALYYSSLMDKYLSIPIGPDNVNLSEAKVLDENDIDEACWKGYKQYGMKKKKGKDVPNCVPVKEESNEGKALNKPFLTPDGPKKRSVFVKGPSGNVVKVNFGDKNLEIKRDDPERRKEIGRAHV